MEKLFLSGKGNCISFKKKLKDSKIFRQILWGNLCNANKIPFALKSDA